MQQVARCDYVVGYNRCVSSRHLLLVSDEEALQRARVGACAASPCLLGHDSVVDAATALAASTLASTAIEAAATAAETAEATAAVWAERDALVGSEDGEHRQSKEDATSKVGNPKNIGDGLDHSTLPRRLRQQRRSFPLPTG